MNIQKTNEYEDWFNTLPDKIVKSRIEARLRRLIDGNAGDVAPVGEAVSELRLHFGCGWRVYYTIRIVMARLSFCWRAAIKARNNVTLNLRWIWHVTFRR
ncbi:MAG: type II toxin-antitoxin system RelE/ParE family toxin [Sulfuriferula sp.]